MRSLAQPIPKLPSGWHLLDAGVLADQRLVFLGADSDFSGSPSRNPAAEATGRLWTFDGCSLVEGPTFPLESPFLKVDQFSDGAWLIVALRSAGEPNARVLSPTGALTSRLMLGDGIEHVGIDQQDRIWVGWFDEGVFGNGAWRVEGEEWAPSSHGVGLFERDGTYRKLPPAPEGADLIADCYAMNAVGDSAWVCTYVGFPLIRFRRNEVRWWRTGLAGVRAVAIHDEHVLAAGGYGPQADRLALLSIEGRASGADVTVRSECRLPLVRREPPAGEPAEISEVHWQPTLLTGRGDTLHLVQDGEWHRWRVGELL